MTKELILYFTVQLTALRHQHLFASWLGKLNRSSVQFFHESREQEWVFLRNSIYVIVYRDVLNACFIRSICWMCISIFFKPIEEVKSLKCANFLWIEGEEIGLFPPNYTSWCCKGADSSYHYVDYIYHHYTCEIRPRNSSNVLDS